MINLILIGLLLWLKKGSKEMAGVSYSVVTDQAVRKFCA